MVLLQKEKGNRITINELKYTDMHEIGNGTFGKVYCGKYKSKMYAIKKYTYSNSPLHITTFRELKILRKLSHNNIVPLEKIVVEKYQIYAVFPFFEFDLAKLMKSRKLEKEEVKYIFKQLVQGVVYLHENNIIHRDIKPANVLISENQIEDNFKKIKKTVLENNVEKFEKNSENDNGIKNNLNKDIENKDKSYKFEVKICDFGMSTQKLSLMTPGVVTLWYRAPELLLGANKYDESIDTWSLGCILFEMLDGTGLFTGNTEIDQLKAIVNILGSIDSYSMINFSEYPMISKYNFLLEGKNVFKDSMIFFENKAKDLISKMVVLDPYKRIKLKDVLNDPFLN